jgi:hypothetical protein
MKLIPKAIIVFATILLLIYIAADNPTPSIIAVTVIGGSLLIAWQTIVILKDKNE